MAIILSLSHTCKSASATKVLVVSAVGDLFYPRLMARAAFAFCP